MTTKTEQDSICNYCGSNIVPDEKGAWVDITGGDGCDAPDGVHVPEPTVHDFWQGTEGHTQTLDSTTTLDGSPVSLTLRAVVAPYLVNSRDEPIVWEYVAYRTYHAAGTNVPELGPWLEVDRQQGWQSEDKAKEWAEKKLEMVGEDWIPEKDAEYAAKVEQVTAVKQALAARDDRLAVDRIASLLGTMETWDGAADLLDTIASVIGEVRPHPGSPAGADYADAFLAATGRAVPAGYDYTADVEPV